MNPVLRGSAAHVFVDSLVAPQLSRGRRSPSASCPAHPGIRCDHGRRRRRGVGRGEADGRSGVGRIGSDVRAGASSVGGDQRDTERRPTGVDRAEGDRDRCRHRSGSWSARTVWCDGTQSAPAVRSSACAESAREAAMQSRRLWLPQVLDVVSFADAASRLNCAIADPDGDDLLDRHRHGSRGPRGWVHRG